MRLFEHDTELNPGPGTYEVKSIIGNSGPRAVICSRKPDNLNITVPGPGAYQPLIFLKSPAFRVGTSPRVRLSKEKSPGPCDYTPKYTKAPANGHKYNEIQAYTIGLEEPRELDCILDETHQDLERILLNQKWEKERGP